MIIHLHFDTWNEQIYFKKVIVVIIAFSNVSWLICLIFADNKDQQRPFVSEKISKRFCHKQLESFAHDQLHSSSTYELVGILINVDCNSLLIKCIVLPGWVQDVHQYFCFTVCFGSPYALWRKNLIGSWICNLWANLIWSLSGLVYTELKLRSGLTGPNPIRSD